ncbi:MAG: discoidin domain-containing protein [Niabella sp.]
MIVDGVTVSQKLGDRLIKELEILISDDNESWESLGVFTLNNIERTRQYLTLPSRKRCRYFKLVPVSGYDAQPQPGLAEISAFVKATND